MYEMSFRRYTEYFQSLDMQGMLPHLRRRCSNDILYTFSIIEDYSDARRKEQ
jgi:hypothetical protein